MPSLIKLTVFRRWVSSFLSWPVSEVCRYPTGILVSVRSMQVPYRYPGQCQEYAGTLQASWLVTGVCKYSGGILASDRGMQVPWRSPDRWQGFGYRTFDSALPRMHHEETFCLHPHCPMEIVTSWRSLLCLTPGAEVDKNVARRKFVAPTYCESNRGPSKLSTDYHFTPGAEDLVVTGWYHSLQQITCGNDPSFGDRSIGQHPNNIQLSFKDTNS